MKYQTSENKLIQSQKTMSVELSLNDTKKAIELLYSQYRNPIRTTVQEIVSNAFDAMTQSGKENVPIKIQVPNEINDFMFGVRDYGNSMDDHTIKTVYMRVNATTKGASNNQIGGFGIGSKTPWSYTDTFILKTFLNGVETHYVLVKGRNTVQIGYKGETEEDNGTEVLFKTKRQDVDSFKSAISRISLLAKTKPQVNGHVRNKVLNKIEASSNIFLIDNYIDSEISKVFVSMGGVLYRICRNDFPLPLIGQITTGLKNCNLIITLPIGSLMPLQTREGLFTQGDEGQNNKTILKKILKSTYDKLVALETKEKSKIVDIETAINYNATAKFTLEHKEFSFGKVKVNCRNQIDVSEFKVKNLFSIITRKRKRYGQGKNLTARKDTQNWITIGEKTVMFSEVSPNIAKLNKRLCEITYKEDVVVLEKHLFENQETYEMLKLQLKAIDVLKIEVPKVTRTLSSSYKRDSNEVVLYNYDNSRSHSVYLDEGFKSPTIIRKKGDNNGIFTAKHLGVLGYDVYYVAPSNFKKFKGVSNVFNDSDVNDLTPLRKEYVICFANRVTKNIQLQWDSEKIELLPENKRILFKTKTSTLDHYNFYGIKKLLKTNKFDKEVRREIKRKIRAFNLEKKLPLVGVVESYDIDGQIATELKTYINNKLGE